MPLTKTRIRVAVELSALALAIVVPLSVHANFFAEMFEPESVAANNSDVQLEGPSDVALLTAQQNPDPIGGKGGAELIVDENALVSTGPVGADDIAAQNNQTGEIRVYTVRPGDALSQVAEMFGVTANTIMWANDISKSTGIQPGDTLVILPIAGVRHIVKSGDSISTIASKYEGDADEILSYNQLASASDIKIGDTLIIPGGELHSAVVKTPAKGTKKGGGSAGGGAGFSHPAPGSVKTQGIHGYNAVDLAASMGSTIRAAAAGEVIVAKTAGWNGGYGSYIVVKHNNGTQTLYAHLSSLNVGVGSYVEQGETIGGMGNSGKSTGTHLHFEVRGGRNPF
jgi:LysM repeat protein